MVRRLLQLILWGLLLALVSSATAGDVVVLGETPVAEFTLPDGSVLKNAFVWRRSSEGLMIVHDDGQYFLNFKLLPADWKAAYLGTPLKTETSPAAKAPELDDAYNLNPILQKVIPLTPAGRQFILRKGADAESDKAALGLALLECLLTGNGDEAKRIFVTIEEKGLNIDAVTLDKLFSECETCNGSGHIEKDCPTCGGTGKCPKCEGTGKRKTGIGKSTIYCTTCRGSGICPECKGEKTFSVVCRRCRGKGKLLERRYCEIARDHYVQQINAFVSAGLTDSVMDSDEARIKSIFNAIPALSQTRSYFFSDAYNGAADANIIAVCMLYSLLKDRSEDAAHFSTMLKVNYADSSEVVLGDYLKPCPACDATGRVERNCSSCNGTGKCKRCNGTGERTSEFQDTKIHCTTCRGSGKCPQCGGDGTISVQCRNCKGSGHLFDEQRARIKLGILVEELTRFYDAQPQ